MKKFLCAMLVLALIASCAMAEGLLNEFDMVARIKSHPGLYLAQLDGLWGVTDGDGNMILETQFEEVGAFKDGSATVRRGDKWGLISDAGEILLEPTLRGEPVFANGFAVAALEDRSRLEEEISGESDYASLYGVIDRAGETIVPFVYDSIEMDDSGETLLVMDGELYGYMKLDGTWIVEPKFARAEPFRGGHAAVSIRNERIDSEDISDPYYYIWGVIDSTGKELIPCAYLWIEADEGELVVVADDDYRYGYMDLSGEWVIRPKFATAAPMKDGTAIASITVDSGEDQSSGITDVYKFGLIGEGGKELLPFEYDHIGRKSDGTLECMRGDGVTIYRIENGEAVLAEVQ